MHITANSYSMISKSLQIAALILFFLLVASKTYGHLDLIEPSLSRELVKEPERAKEIDRQKDIDRASHPDLSSKERAARDRDLESGRSLGAA